MRSTGHPAHAERVDRLLQAVDTMVVRTWFDLGLQLDHLRDNRPDGGDFAGTPAEFTAACQQSLGSLGTEVAGAIPLDAHVTGWRDSDTLLSTRLDRGSDGYNALIGSLWDHTRSLVHALAAAIADHEIEALVVQDVWADARNVPLAVALALLSDGLRMPVISLRHSPWWTTPDAVSANRHMGEVYSVIETCLPWDAPWVVHLPADAADRAWLVEQVGMNPARIVDSSEPTRALVPVGEWAAGLNLHHTVVAALDAHSTATQFDARFERVTRASTRHYQPGLTELEYMIKLNSLVDPSAFRLEENELRGRVYGFAEARAAEGGLDAVTTRRLLHAVALLFDYHVGEDELVVDHSLSYRHRQRRHYPWRKLTEQELTGVIGGVARTLQPIPAQTTVSLPDAQNDLTAAVSATQQGARLAIDQTDRLGQALDSGAAIIWLPNADSPACFGAEAALFRDFATGPVTLILPRGWGSGCLHAGAAQAAIHDDPTLAAWHGSGRLKVVESDCIATGAHLAQLGPAGDVFHEAIDAGATVVAFGHGNLLALDLLNAPSIRIGHCGHALAAAFMDLTVGDGYCLWVPTGLRPSLAYPTPIQTPREFAAALSGDVWTTAVARLGEAEVLARLTADAEQAGTPVAPQLAVMAGQDVAADETGVESSLLTGVHANGAPWSGAYARVQAGPDWRFATVFAASKSDTVLDLISAFEASGGASPALAWNGGYILNPELVGKLGLPEDYIGSPLGLLIENGAVRSLPLFNKPALAFLHDGSIQIREANVADGLGIGVPGGGWLELDAGVRNLITDERPAYFDLLCDAESVPLTGRVAYRFAGRRIISVHRGVETLPLLPVGLMVTVPEGSEPDGWIVGADVDFTLPGWGEVANAIEAGPMLVRDGRESIEMEDGGWTRSASIRTQAARLDYTHMRGPKIGVGLTADDALIVVAINGRIRESVGATHGELARILLDMGARTAMGFDPGGSVTLVVRGRQLNISPYNRDYVDNPWSLPPQPRFVGNAILAIRPSGPTSR